MPELPEVETVVRELRSPLVGRRISAVRVGPLPLRRRWLPSWEAQLVGRRVRELGRRGKWIILELDGALHLVFHLGMTGQLTIKQTKEPFDRHTHLVLELGGTKRQLRFRDIRRFGSVTLFGNDEFLRSFFQEAKLGPEPFELNAGYWQECLAKTERCLKAVLLDQRVVAGVGNIYADETLFQARLHPAQLGHETSKVEALRLRRALIQVLNRAIIKRGSSIRDYVGGSGKQGDYQREFRVYGRAGQPCPRCRVAIERIRLAGRSTHYCPQCQQQRVREKRHKQKLQR